MKSTLFNEESIQKGLVWGGGVLGFHSEEGGASNIAREVRT